MTLSEYPHGKKYFAESLDEKRSLHIVFELCSIKCESKFISVSNVCVCAIN